ncbi:nuclear transport factor 2 family protein [Saccharopolyspora flava]|uniref:SnoaL-like domain-containing protein n=1 Tax=Saccharopolyspora flava TaxID=95161 RepID=A0A1I6QIL9_9PSEU|nr:nuclear transport factor 2 family protein [Saccharopolyspora flava]SFS52347.1 SnoaL-like domain-containing protein [Saccharopolyspora flava]
MPSTPEATMRRLLELMLAGDTDAVADLWVEDGTAEFPFAAGSSPRRLVGREEVRRYLAGFPQAFEMREISAFTAHTTQRPGTAVIEYHAEGRTVSTGATCQVDYVVVLTVHNGLIVSFRDYWSPLAGAAAFGTLPELIESLKQEVL